MGIVANREQILESFDLIKPTMMLSVPALFNRVYDGVIKKIQEGSPFKQKIFAAALANSRIYNHAKEFGESPGFFVSLKQSLFDKIVFSKIRDRSNRESSFSMNREHSREIRTKNDLKYNYCLMLLLFQY